MKQLPIWEEKEERAIMESCVHPENRRAMDATRELNLALDILEDVVRVQGPCDHHDHHGCCQTHNCQPRNECFVARATALLKRHGRQG